MKCEIHTLRINSFRRFEKYRLELSPGINLLEGDNAKGKTTLLEPIYLGVTGRSFRTSQLTDLIQNGREACQFEIYFRKNKIDQQIKFALRKGEKKIQYNSSFLSSSLPLLGILQGVLLCPKDVDLIRGSPEHRRHYLDLQIAQVDPLYVHHLSRYTKALKQRNWMLREKKGAALEVFEQMLAQAAAYIVPRRLKLITGLQNRMERLYSLLSAQSESIQLIYQPSIGDNHSIEKLVEKWRNSRSKELDLGYTLAGPHRDDFKVLLASKSAKEFASEGEIRSLAAILRLSEWEEMQLATGLQPLLLVDDFGMSLDQKRLENFWNIFKTLGQVIVTSTHSPVFSSNYNKILLN